METALRVIKLALYSAGVFALVALGVLFLEARRDLRNLNAKADEVLVQSKTTLQHADDYTKKQQEALDSTTQAAMWLLINTDHSLNGCKKCPSPGLLPQATGTLVAHDRALTQLETQLSQQFAELEPGVKDFNRAMAATATNLSDPAITNTLHNVESVSASTAVTSQNVAATTGDVKKVADDVTDTVHARLHPSKKKLTFGVLLTMLKAYLTHPFW